jgi:small-conductance mechanosensitive channel
MERRIFAYVAAMTVLLLFVIFAVYLVTSVYRVIPVNFLRLVNAIFAVVIVFIIFRIITGFLSRYLRRYIEVSKVHPIIFIINVFGYFIIGVALLASLGIDVSSLILGGSLVSVVIGLAAQTVLANQFAGLLIAIIRPFSIGDSITLNTWQYGGAYPVLFPKYFSVDRIESTGYSGTVTNLTINYTTICMSNGDHVKIPNNLVFQAAVIIRTGSISVKARYEVPKYIPFDMIRKRVAEEIVKLPDYRGEAAVTVDETTLNTYILMVVAKFSGTDADLMRSNIHNLLMGIVEPLKYSSVS